MCENKDCKTVCFHFDCLRIRCPPKQSGNIRHANNSPCPPMATNYEIIDEHIHFLYNTLREMDVVV